MKAWSLLPQVFGREALTKLAVDPGIGAYVEGSRTAWAAPRFRTGTGGCCCALPLDGTARRSSAPFQVAPGTSISISRCAAPAIPAKPKSLENEGRHDRRRRAGQPPAWPDPQCGSSVAPQAASSSPRRGMDWKSTAKPIPVLGRRGLSLAAAGRCLVASALPCFSISKVIGFSKSLP